MSYSQAQLDALVYGYWQHDQVQKIEGRMPASLPKPDFVQANIHGTTIQTWVPNVPGVIVNSSPSFIPGYIPGTGTYIGQWVLIGYVQGTGIYADGYVQPPFYQS